MRKYNGIACSKRSVQKTSILAEEKTGYLLEDEYAALLSQEITKIMGRWPDHFEGGISQEFLLFAGHLELSFKHPRSPIHLAKLLCSYYLINKALNRTSQFFLAGRRDSFPFFLPEAPGTDKSAHHTGVCHK